MARDEKIAFTVGIIAGILLGMIIMYLWLASNGEIVSLLGGR